LNKKTEEMKKIICTALVFGAIMSARLNNVYGNTPLLPDNPEKSTVVTFYGVNNGDRLYIRDNNGKSVYSERIKTDGIYTRLFNLSHLPENHYYFEMNKADVITILPFDVERDDVTLQKGLKTDIAKPELVSLKDQVILSRDVKTAQSMKIKIYYKGLELVHSEEIDKIGKLLRKYDFSNSRNGQYLFHIQYDEGRVFTEYVNVL
jgi:hypothetical protein